MRFGNMGTDMTESNVIIGDPWLQKSGPDSRLPEGVVLACAYELHLGADSVVEAAFLRRTEAQDELWVLKDVRVAWIGAILDGNSLPCRASSAVGRVLVAGRTDRELPACIGLLDTLLRAYQGFCWPTGFVMPGIVGEQDFNRMLSRLETGYRSNSAKASKNETKIIRVARELELHPEPTGDSTTRWRARCPRTSHCVYIDATRNEFFCGWCRRKGGLRELRQFVEEREKRHAERSGSDHAQ